MGAGPLARVGWASLHEPLVKEMVGCSEVPTHPTLAQEQDSLRDWEHAYARFSNGIFR